MKKIIFLILLFILLAVAATGSPLDAERTGAGSARAGLAARLVGQ
jgi:hypothetical protein